MWYLIKNISQRSMILFEESIRSKYTKQNYISHLNQFKKFTGIHDENQWLEFPTNDLQVMLENYILYLKHTANPNSIPSKFRGIKHFFVMNRINLNWNIIYKMFPQKQKTPSLRAYTTNEIKEILYNTKNIRDKALIHFLASTGARIGVFDHPLAIRHMKKMPCGCYAILLYAGHIEEYWAFLTPQASRLLDTYHDQRRKSNKIFDSNAPIFTIGKTMKQLGWSGSRSVVYRAVSKSNIRKCKQDNRYDVQIDHGFRKRFNTILKLDNSINYNIAEKLLGHKNGLDGVYFTPTIDEMFEEFKKIMHKNEIQ